MTVESALKRYSKAKASKGVFDKTLKDAYKFALPNTETINDKAEGGNKKEELFDDTLQIAVQKYANRLSAQLIPFGKEWAILKAGGDVPTEQQEQIDLALEKISKVIFNNLPHSNFYSACHEAFQDLACSTGVLICEQGDGIMSKLRFRSIPIKELILENSTKGLANTVWREFEMECKDIDYLYPDAKLTDDLNKMINEKPDNKVSLIEGVVFNERKNNFDHILIYKKDYLLQRQLDSSPFIVFREKKAPNETYGRGRVLDVLPTVKTLNELARLDLFASSLNANGVYTVADDGVVNPYTIQIKAGALIPVDSNDQSRPSIKPLEVATNFQVNLDRILRLQARVNEVMLSQPFGSVEETPVRTATEMSIRNNDLAQTTMATFSRIQSEFLEPLIQRILYVLAEQGAIPPLRADGREVSVKFTSPVSRMQDTEELANIQQFLTYAQALPPELVVGTMKMEEIPQYIATKLGLPKSLMRTKAEQDAAKQAVSQTELAQTQAMANAQQPTQQGA